MAQLAESGAPVVPLSEVTATPGSFALTFDDGFENFIEHALPVLEQYRFPATVFVISAYCGRRNDWASQPQNIPRLPLMSWTNLRSLSRELIQIGAHSVTHPDLTRISCLEVETELRQSKLQIEDQIGAPVQTLAYPYGTSSARIRTIAADEFRLACGTRMGFVGGTSDVFNLPRVDAYYLQYFMGPDTLLTRSGRFYINLRAALREMRSRSTRQTHRYLGPLQKT